MHLINSDVESLSVLPKVNTHLHNNNSAVIYSFKLKLLTKALQKRSFAKYSKSKSYCSTVTLGGIAQH